MNKTETTKIGFWDFGIFVMGGFLFWVLGYLIGSYWSNFSTAFWWANKPDREELKKKYDL